MGVKFKLVQHPLKEKTFIACLYEFKLRFCSGNVAVDYTEEQFACITQRIFFSQPSHNYLGEMMTQNGNLFFCRT